MEKLTYFLFLPLVLELFSQVARYNFSLTPFHFMWCVCVSFPDDLRAAGFSGGRAVPRAEEGKPLFLNRCSSKQEGCSGCGAF